MNRFIIVVVIILFTSCENTKKSTGGYDDFTEIDNFSVELIEDGFQWNCTTVNNKISLCIPSYWKRLNYQEYDFVADLGDDDILTYFAFNEHEKFKESESTMEYVNILLHEINQENIERVDVYEAIYKNNFVIYTGEVLFKNTDENYMYIFNIFEKRGKIFDLGMKYNVDKNNLPEGVMQSILYNFMLDNKKILRDGDDLKKFRKIHI